MQKATTVSSILRNNFKTLLKITALFLTWGTASFYLTEHQFLGEVQFKFQTDRTKVSFLDLYRDSGEVTLINPSPIRPFLYPKRPKQDNKKRSTDQLINQASLFFDFLREFEDYSEIRKSINQLQDDDFKAKYWIDFPRRTKDFYFIRFRTNDTKKATDILRNSISEIFKSVKEYNLEMLEKVKSRLKAFSPRSNAQIKIINVIQQEIANNKKEFSPIAINLNQVKITRKERLELHIIYSLLLGLLSSFLIIIYKNRDQIGEDNCK